MAIGTGIEQELASLNVAKLYGKLVAKTDGMSTVSESGEIGNSGLPTYMKCSPACRGMYIIWGRLSGCKQRFESSNITALSEAKNLRVMRHNPSNNSPCGKRTSEKAVHYDERNRACDKPEGKLVLNQTTKAGTILASIFIALGLDDWHAGISHKQSPQCLFKEFGGSKPIPLMAGTAAPGLA